MASAQRGEYVRECLSLSKGHSLSLNFAQRLLMSPTPAAFAVQHQAPDNPLWFCLPYNLSAHMGQDWQTCPSRHPWALRSPRDEDRTVW